METNLLAWLKTHQRWALIIGGSGLLLVGVVVVIGLLKKPVSDPAVPAIATSQTMTSGRQSYSGTQTSESRQQVSHTQAASTSGPMYVDVKGAVKQPGIYQVKAQMRVADVIALAKGLRPKADRLQVNLAEKVTDQQVIYVPEKGETKKPVASQSAASSTGGSTGGTKSTGGDSGAQINLNTADVTELQKLAGVGQKKAEKIIEYRDSHDGFKTVDDLKQVSGIGDKTLEKFRSQLTV
ncbi:helix-hairpin-helix domain-containing protein [Lactiplantibacillus mudanjiangensis]|uniref:Competence protein ComEA [Lactobacillus sp.] n=1 Tax=Lactiplantibacillus mudanjiangensis TaxID=1296538 RepID=A0A660E7U5_9LACO|nr:helix-hairpin-helix domain-containing protein [Lactiplantibacillus mudanjiangensis]VDG23883.1 competence protein ComEA [Lactobacillus sp.] [Lactiplantibacillus mudanjiangensis]VDG30112.1 competence protein ComEA [Lactobacillus sp.] [Lactiplantibacillus mudanjiangensis]